jgi:hypothetical protein
MKIFKGFVVYLLLLISLTTTAGEEDELIDLKKEILSRFSSHDEGSDIFEYMNMNNKFTDKYLLFERYNNSKYNDGKEFKFYTDLSLDNNINQRMKYYFYNYLVKKFLQYDWDMYTELRNMRETTSASIRKKSQKILDISTGAIAITSLVKGGIKDIKHLNKIKDGVKNGGSTKLYLSQLNYLIGTTPDQTKINIAKDLMQGEITGLFSNGPMGRVMSQCILVSDMSALVACGLETAGQGILTLGDLYSGFLNIKDIRKSGSAHAAMFYLDLYYLFGEDKDKLINFLDSVNVNMGNQLSVESLEDQLTVIMQFKFNKKNRIGGAVEYNYSEAEKYINNYKKYINSMTTNFVNNFSKIILKDGDMGVRFSDVKKGVFIFNKLQIAKAYKIDIKGFMENNKNYFKPDQNITNAEAMALSFKGFTKGGKGEDIANKEWHSRKDIKKYYDWFNEWTIDKTPLLNLTGITDSNLYQNMTRLQMAKFLYFFMKDFTSRRSESGLNFPTNEKLNAIKKQVYGDWNYEAMVLKNMSIVSGKPNGKFEPNQLITRGEFLIMLTNSLNRLTCGQANCKISDILEIK